jgi:hypothetical protein
MPRVADSVAWAWEARGGRMAQYTDADRFEVFHWKADR